MNDRLCERVGGRKRERERKILTQVRRAGMGKFSGVVVIDTRE